MKARQKEILENASKIDVTTGCEYIINDGSCLNTSVGVEVTGNQDIDFITPPAGLRVVVKGITIVAEGNSGDISIATSGGKVLLPLYVSNFSRAGTSSALNIVLDPEEVVKIVTTGRDSNRSFVGVTYKIVNDI